MKGLFASIMFLLSVLVNAQGGMSEPFVSDRFQVYNGMMNYKVWGMFDFLLRYGDEFELTAGERELLDKMKLSVFPVEYLFREQQHWSVVEFYKLPVDQNPLLEIENEKYSIRISDVLLQRQSDWTFNFFIDERFSGYVMDNNRVANILVDAKFFHLKIFWAYNKVLGRMEQHINAVGIEGKNGDLIWVGYPAFKSWFNRNDFKTSFFTSIENMEFPEQPYLTSPSDMGGLIQYDEDRQFDVFEIWIKEIRLKQIIASNKEFNKSGPLKVSGTFGNIERKVDSKGVVGSLIWTTKKGGKIAEFNYRQGYLEGKATVWHSNGQISTEANFIEGLAEGTWKSYFPNGQMASIRTYQMGALDGSFKEYYSNNQLAVSCNFQNAYLFGAFQKWNNQGGLIMSGSMNQGVKDGLWSYEFQLPTVLFEYISRNIEFWTSTFKIENRFSEETLKDHKLLVKASYELERNDKCLNQLCSRMLIDSVE
jgi:antitoxin component YwqK of YwqJK toxin-antitoxin module